MRKIVFDIETKNTFQDVGKRDPALLDISIVAIHDSETNSYSSYLENELNKLWPIIERADCLIGFNSDHFDIPLLNKYYPGDLTSIKSVDLMKEIQKTLGRRIGLDAVVQATLGLAKSGHGLQAIQWWHDGEIEKIREYCIQDVRVTKKLYDYAFKKQCVKIKDILSGKLQKITLDTSDWEEVQESGLTHSLPF
jgi:DEAD/DEAH box helicase domain-containing protein